MTQNHAAAIQRAMLTEYNNFERTLEDDQQAIATFFMAGHEFRVLVSEIGYSPAGLINVFGEREDGSPIDIFMQAAQVAYVVEAVPKDRPKRVGFLD